MFPNSNNCEDNGTNDPWLDLGGSLEGDQPKVGELVMCACQQYPVIKGQPTQGRT